MPILAFEANRTLSRQIALFLWICFVKTDFTKFLHFLRILEQLCASLFFSDMKCQTKSDCQSEEICEENFCVVSEGQHCRHHIHCGLKNVCIRETDKRYPLKKVELSLNSESIKVDSIFWTWCRKNMY